MSLPYSGRVLHILPVSAIFWKRLHILPVSTVFRKGTLHSARLWCLPERSFTFCQYLLSSGKELHALPVSAVFRKRSWHFASLWCIPEGSFTFCLFLLSSGRGLYTLPISERRLKLCYIFIYLSMYLHIFISGNFTLKNLCRIVALFYWKSERYSLKKVTGKYRNLPKFTGHYHKLPENRNEKIFFCRIVALIFNKLIPELWDKKCDRYSYFLPLAEEKCIFLEKIKKP